MVIVTSDYETGGLKIISNKGKGSILTVAWSTNWHTSQRVDIYGWGSRSGLVSDVNDNTDIYGVMQAALQVQSLSVSHSAFEIE